VKFRKTIQIGFGYYIEVVIKTRVSVVSNWKLKGVDITFQPLLDGR